MISRLEKHFEPVVIVTTLVIIIVLVFADVVARLAFATSIAFAGEVARLAFVCTIYFGVSCAIRDRRHMRVTVLLDLAPPELQRVLMLLAAIVLLLIVGTFLETLAAIVIMTPVLLPVTTELGVDPVHFGIVMIVALAIGFVTPPLGANLFMAAQVGRIPFDDIARRIFPWVIAMIGALLIIAFIPALSLGLPWMFLDYGG